MYKILKDDTYGADCKSMNDFTEGDFSVIFNYINNPDNPANKMKVVSSQKASKESTLHEITAEITTFDETMKNPIMW